MAALREQINIIEIGAQKRVPVASLEDKTEVGPRGLNHVINEWQETKAE